MVTNFRSELFSICKTLEKKDRVLQIRQLVHDLSVVKSKDEKPLHGSFAQIAKNSNNEFHGYLFLDENIDMVPSPFVVERLTQSERSLLEIGHRTMLRLIELCLSDLMRKSKPVFDAMNPYFLYKPVHLSSRVEPIFTDEELQPLVTAFKSGVVYQSLMSTNFDVLFERFDTKHLRLLVGSIEKEIGKNLNDNTTNDIREFSGRIYPRINNREDTLFAFSVLIYALKSSLSLACRMIYRSICGVQLFVLNNDNIISIEKNSSTVVCHFYKVLSLDFDIDITQSAMGSVLLLDCDPPNENHIHEFGVLIAQTLNLHSEFGQSAKYSFVSVNEELICFYNLTNSILKSGLPNIKRIQNNGT